MDKPKKAARIAGPIAKRISRKCCHSNLVKQSPLKSFIWFYLVCPFSKLCCAVFQGLFRVGGKPPFMHSVKWLSRCKIALNSGWLIQRISTGIQKLIRYRKRQARPCNVTEKTLNKMSLFFFKQCNHLIWSHTATISSDIHSNYNTRPDNLHAFYTGTPQHNITENEHELSLKNTWNTPKQ